MTERTSALVTLLFTDLVGSTELLSRAGDEEAQRIFSAHHQLLAGAVAEHGGDEVKWLGDGLMVAFPSASDAVSCAIAMQQTARRPVHGERLAIRVGLHAGEALRDVSDYFGTAVVTARRLCDRAEGGQILSSDLVAGLLAGRTGFAFSPLGPLELKGLPHPVPTFEVRYETEAVHGFAGEVALVGREAEMTRLAERLREAASGRGGLVFLAGEAGIGKTRLAEEVAARAEREGAIVLFGRGYEGDWSPSYAAFAEALGAHAGVTTPEELRADLGPGAAPLAELVPRIRGVLPDLGDPVPLPPEEERFRLLDAMAQFLVARSRRAPVLVLLDDLHWADKGTVAMLRHLARFAAKERLLLLGTYRDVDLEPGHPLVDALGAFRREAGYEHLHLEGLDDAGVTKLLAALAEHEVEDKVGAAWARQTDGNPFFVRELLRYLIEEGKLYRGPDGRWTTAAPLRDLGLPQGVREVVVRRLSRLSPESTKLLGAAAAFEGPFRFDVVAGMAGFSEDEALDALDEALAAHVLAPAGGAETYAFTHSLPRQTIYEQLSPSRQVRLHRRAAEALEAGYGPRPSPTQAGEIAVQYHRSRDLPGAQPGVEPALVAATHAQATGGHEEAATFLRMALDLLPEGDDRRPRLLGRLGIVLAWALVFDEAVAAAAEAGDAIAETEGKQAAAEYLSDAAYVCSMAGGTMAAWDLARQGLTYAGARDVAWARLVSFDLERRAAEDPEHPGIPTDSTERRESARILRAARLDPLGIAPMEAVFDSREEARSSSNLIVLSTWAGEYVRCLPLSEAEATEAESLGRLARAARAWVNVAVCQIALGHLGQAHQTLERTRALSARLGAPVPNVLAVQHFLCAVMDEGWEEFAATFRVFASLTSPALAWTRGYVQSASASIAAHLGQAEEAIASLGRLVPWLERAPAWTIAFSVLAWDAAETLWLLERLDHADVVERALREKVIRPDFRYPTVDGRLALARLCALSGRHDEARSWFAEARRVLDEQGERPLRAIADYDEALMYARRGEPGDAEAAQPLLDAARRQFEAIGMTGWIRRADELARRLDEAVI